MHRKRVPHVPHATTAAALGSSFPHVFLLCFILRPLLTLTCWNCILLCGPRLFVPSFVPALTFFLPPARNQPLTNTKPTLGAHPAFRGPPERDKYLPALPQGPEVLLSSTGVHARGGAPRLDSAAGEAGGQDTKNMTAAMVQTLTKC